MLHNLDSDSSKIIEAVRSTGVVITEAMRLYVDYIVSNMKAIGTWDLCNAVYGFVGGTAASHKFNWKDLRDVDAAFRLTYGGTVTHSANGMQGNGTTGFADTYIIPNNVHNSTDGVSILTYIKTASTITSDIFYGANDGNNGGTFQYLLRPTQFYGQALGLIATSSLIGVSPSKFTSFNIKGISDSYLMNKQRIINGATASGSTNLPLISTIIFGRKSITGADIVNTINSNAEISFFADSKFLTQSQSIQQSQIVTNAQNILNRA